MHQLRSTILHFQALLGIKLYLVGGSVRDHLLGVPHSDLDFATPASPDEIEAGIRKAGKKPLLMGKRFGTIAFKYRLPGDSAKTSSPLIEITTFRTETYGNTRKPTVEFVSDIVKDLSRRDFTVNAMAVNDEGKLIDPFSGHADLKAGTIRFVGEPAVRINEDPLRMLRACRLSAQFSFVPTTETKEKIRANAVKILNISHERWTQELDKILTSTHPHRGLDALAQTELLRFILPEIWIQYHYDQNSPYHRLSLFEHTKKTVQLVRNDINVRWAALLHDVGKPFARIDKTPHKRTFFIGKLRRLWEKDTQSNYPYHSEIGAELVEKIGRYLKWSNDRIDMTKDLVLHHLTDASPIDKADSAAR
jgi:tRNA nucleotidyltransferase/poly(A) polymerase